MPQRGATLKTQPREVVLHFSEAVEGNFGAVRVFDAAARRVDDGRSFHPGGSGARLAVGLKPGLPDGTYVATYRVISADSHPISGGLVFSIGAPGAAAAPTVADLIGDSAAGPVTQTAFGDRARPDLPRDRAHPRRPGVPARRLAAGAARRGGHRRSVGRGGGGVRPRACAPRCSSLPPLGVVAGCAGIVLQGATAGATSAWSALSPDVVGDVLGTRFGHVWGLRVLAFLALGGALALALAPPRPRRPAARARRDPGRIHRASPPRSAATRACSRRSRCSSRSTSPTSWR